MVCRICELHLPWSIYYPKPYWIHRRHLLPSLNPVFQCHTTFGAKLIILFACALSFNSFATSPTSQPASQSFTKPKNQLTHPPNQNNKLNRTPDKEITCKLTSSKDSTHNPTSNGLSLIVDQNTSIIIKSYNTSISSVNLLFRPDYNGSSDVSSIDFWDCWDDLFFVYLLGGL